ncbi:hypothetical protein [Thalassotalea ganghwensis]
MTKTFRYFRGGKLVWCACSKADYDLFNVGVTNEPEVLTGIGDTEHQALDDYFVSLTIYRSMEQ